MSHEGKNVDYQVALKKCRELIESRLGWRNSASWQSGDFEKLSNLIFNETGVVLSSSTLKRIWGKVTYSSVPNVSTLDALAQYAGFPGWRVFESSLADHEEPPVLREERKVTKRKFAIGQLTGGVLVIAVLSAIGFTLFGPSELSPSKKRLVYGDLRFSSRPVTVGVPNTVIFDYDATNSNADSVFIQQNWDSRRRFKVDKNGHTFTSTYYEPGNYKAKLVLDDSIVKEHDVYIESEGWVGLIRDDREPVYLHDRIFHADGVIGISEQQIDELNLEDTRKRIVFALANVGKGFNRSSDRFQLTLGIQNTSQRTICQRISIIVLGTEGVIIIPLSKVGCVGKLVMTLGKQDISGKTHDLSALGVDFSQPSQVRCVSADGTIRITVNDVTAFEGPFKENIGLIAGMKIFFDGGGVITSFQLE